MKKQYLPVIFLLLLCLQGCNQHLPIHTSDNVGLLVPTTINDPVWGSKGYQGLLKIHSNLGKDVFYKEDILTVEEVKEALAFFEENNVSLVFGHGNEYEPIFAEIYEQYPHLHFVYFNGNFTAPNVTSLKFESYAMGFFGGMVAAKMSSANHLGIVAAFQWQPEIYGFIDGATYQNEAIDITIEYTYDWNNITKAIDYVETFIANGVDVVYPAGDAFNVPVIEIVKEKGLYVIGFISDQSDFGQSTVLTSTVQHVDELYEKVAKMYAKNELPADILHYDFKDGVISMGEYSNDIPKEFIAEMDDHIETYQKTGKLPNEY